MDPLEAATAYYTRKFGSNQQQAFTHLVKEVGELARGLEKNLPDVRKHELTELAALVFWFARQEGMDLLPAVQQMYERKLAEQGK